MGIIRGNRFIAGVLVGSNAFFFFLHLLDMQNLYFLMSICQALSVLF